MEGCGRGKLLLVEDEAVLRRLIGEFLRGEGYDVVEASDGSEGTATYDALHPFDLVLLDLNLPLLSGVDVCRHIKRIQPQQPVLICSAAILDWHVTALQDLNVHQFLTKPYHPMDLLDRIASELTRPTTADEESDDSPIAVSHRRSMVPSGDRSSRGLFRPHPLG